MKHLLKSWHALALMLVLASAITVGMTSCGNDDEPGATTIDYYMRVDEVFLVNGSDRQTNYINPVTRMKEAIRRVYPTPNAQGDDEAVIAACDQEFQDYVEMYTGYHDHITCLVRLIRATKEGYVIKQSQQLRTYVYDINSSD